MHHIATDAHLLDHASGASSAPVSLLLATHLAGGLRLLAFEFLAWSPSAKSALAAVGGVALAVGGLFVLNLL